MSDRLLSDEYAGWLARLKSEIQAARTQAALAVNQELVRLYHRIGTEILERQGREGWGARVIARLSSDLRAEFPDMKGLSGTNLKYMKVFAELCPGVRIGQQAADRLPWFHIVVLLTKVTEPSEREWYAAQAIEQGWSRATLEAQIKSQLHLRQGAALTNFNGHLAAPHAKLAAEALKDPYHFDFLGLGEEAQEHEIENALVRHITRFLLELGSGFAFVGRQHRIEAVDRMSGEECDRSAGSRDWSPSARTLQKRAGGLPVRDRSSTDRSTYRHVATQLRVATGNFDYGHCKC